MSNEINVNIPAGQDQVKVFTGTAECYQLKGAKFDIESTQSMIDLINRKSNKEVAMILYNENGIKTILDDTISNRTKDIAYFQFNASLQLKEWKRILKNGLTQKEFVNFLKLREDEEIQDIENIMANIQKLKIDTKIAGEYEDDGNNVTFVFKSKDGEEMSKLPKLIYAQMPIIHDGKEFKLEFELELIKPKTEEEKPRFVVSCPKLERYWKQAVESEIDALKEALDGYLILNGSTESR
ncbi:MAG: hypothetical protein RR420_05355 [Anaerovoracaceae bacterium]